jgi:small subunit ribosomal protein S6
MARLYDLMVLLDPNAPRERQEAVLSEVESMVGSGGQLVGHHEWGVRRLAYEIDHRPEAAYHLFQFESEPPLLDQLRQRLRIMDGVLRFRIILAKRGSEPPPPPHQQAPRRREDEERDGKVAARAAADASPG